MDKKLDVVIFGATGFTGKRTIAVLHKMVKLYAPNIKWGIAGRSESKLKDALKYAETQLGGVSLDEVTIIIADIQSTSSLDVLTKSTRVLINCCGPFVTYGEPVLAACLRQCTDYVDVTAEPQFVMNAYLKYSEEARRKGVYLVNCCGFDCIPVDLGITFLEANFDGTLNSVETYMKIWTVTDKQCSSAVNRGTWESAIEALSQAWDIRCLYKKTFKGALPESGPHLNIKYLHRPQHETGWAVFLPSTDRIVAKRSQLHFYHTDAKRPVQVETYLFLKSFPLLLLLTITAFVVMILAQFSIGRYVLLMYPSFFTAGRFSNAEPSEDTMDAHHYSFTLKGTGWSRTINESEVKNVPMDKTVYARVSGSNGYVITCVGISLTALMLITERDRLPQQGGVYTPAAAFSRTSLVEKLRQQGVAFEIFAENSKPSVKV